VGARDLIKQFGDSPCVGIEASHQIVMLDVGGDYYSVNIKFVSEYVIQKFPRQLFRQSRADALHLVGITLRNFPKMCWYERKSL